MNLKDQLLTKQVERANKIERQREMTDRATVEERDLSHNEDKTFGRLEDEIRDLDRQVANLEVQLQNEPVPVRQIDDRNREDRDESRVLLGREQRMADLAPTTTSVLDAGEVAEFSLGLGIRGLLTGHWDGAQLEKRVLSEGTAGAGGHLVPEELSTRLIDRTRNRARVLEAGAQTLRLSSDTVSLPRLATGVTPGWRAENAAVAESDPTFERVTFTPKSLATFVRLSWELWEDMVEGGAQLIENELVNALALEVDRAALRGTGSSNQPTGVRNQSGVTIQSLGTNGATPTYADFMTSITTLLTANYQPNAAIMAPRTSQKFYGLADTTNQPLNPPKPVADLDWYVTAQVPTDLTQGSSTDASELYVGEWQNLVIGIRPYVRIEMSAPKGPLGVQLKATDQRYIENHQFGVFASIRADVQLLKPSFVVQTGVRAV